MLQGRFAGAMVRPIVDGRLTLVKTGATEDISFLFDTGADYTVIMPIDSTRLGIDFSDPSLPWETLHGIGSARGVRLPTLIAFTDSDNGNLYVYRVRAAIPDPQTVAPDTPSFLGRDVIHRWRVSYEGGNGILDAIPLTWDLIF